MTLPRTAAQVLSGHVTLEIRCIDRMLLTFRQPRLQYGQGSVDGGMTVPAAPFPFRPNVGVGWAAAAMFGTVRSIAVVRMGSSYAVAVVTGAGCGWGLGCRRRCG